MRTMLAALWRMLHLPTNLQLRIMRFVNDEFLIGLTAIVFNNKDEVMLVKHTYREVAWSLPGGYLKAKEHPTEGLEREILEETGLVVCIDQPLKIRTDRSTGRLDLCYIGTFIGGEFRKSDEVSEYGFYSFENLPILLKDQIFFIKEALAQRVHTQQKVLAKEAQKQNLVYKMRSFFKRQRSS